MAVFVDIGQGAGLAGATGVRPFLPPLLAGGLAREDLGLDFGGTDWRFLESPGFLLAILALAVLSYGAERSGANRSPDSEGAALGERDAPPGRGGDEAAGRLARRAATGGSQVAGRGRTPLQWLLGALAALVGALLCAGSFAADGHPAWIGALVGTACAALGWLAVGRLFEGAARRVESRAAGLLAVYAEGIALALAALAVALPPLSYLALAGFVLLLVKSRQAGERKYAGLRVLR